MASTVIENNNVNWVEKINNREMLSCVFSSDFTKLATLGVNNFFCIYYCDFNSLHPRDKKTSGIISGDNFHCFFDGSTCKIEKKMEIQEINTTRNFFFNPSGKKLLIECFSGISNFYTIINVCDFTINHMFKNNNFCFVENSEDLFCFIEGGVPCVFDLANSTTTQIQVEKKGVYFPEKVHNCIFLFQNNKYFVYRIVFENGVCSLKLIYSEKKKISGFIRSVVFRNNNVQIYTHIKQYTICCAFLEHNTIATLFFKGLKPEWKKYHLYTHDVFPLILDYTT